jgi:hypothetical protein
MRESFRFCSPWPLPDISTRLTFSERSLLALTHLRIPPAKWSSSSAPRTQQAFCPQAQP